MDKLIDLFEAILPISEDEKNRIKELVKKENIKKKTKYVEEGYVCRKMGFVVDGIFKVVRTNPAGDEFIPYFISEGHFAVALESFTNEVPSEEYIEAITPCVVITISREAFNQLETEVQNFPKIISLLKEKALIEKHKLKAEMLNDDAETRYRKLAQKQPTVIQYVPQNNIAQYLGITQYTLSRIRGKS